MGQSSPKQFSLPTTFGGVPQTNNQTQVQPYQQVSGPGFAAMSGFDQTQQQAPQAAPVQGEGRLNPFVNGGAFNGSGAGMISNRKNLMADPNLNPFQSLVNQ